MKNAKKWIFFFKLIHKHVIFHSRAPEACPVAGLHLALVCLPENAQNVPTDKMRCTSAQTIVLNDTVVEDVALLKSFRSVREIVGIVLFVKIKMAKHTMHVLLSTTSKKSLLVLKRNISFSTPYPLLLKSLHGVVNLLAVLL